jgi:acetylornithine/N-succinyldiaminopimelate aminotransferase
MNTFERDQTYIAGTYARFPIEIVSGKGSILTGSDGKEYIDLGTGIAVNCFGVADEEWQKAVTAQLAKFQHTSNLYYTEPCAKLAEMLCERTGMKKVFFANSGAEANECIIKVARKYASDKYSHDRNVIITLENSFHGRTLTTLAATGQEHYHEEFLPLTPGFVSYEVGDLAGIESLVKTGTVAGILFEAVQGEGGVLPLPAEFVQGLAKICEENDVLLMADEVQIGNGRSGKLYGYMNFGVQPDVVSTAKALGGGLPLGAALLGEKVKDTLTPGSHGSTFGGNPVCCAGAINILSRIDDKLLASVREKSAYIMSKLEGASGIQNVSGMGLMIGFEPTKPLADVVTACRENGVLVLTAKNKVRLLPALNIPMPLVEQAVDVILQVCAEK